MGRLIVIEGVDSSGKETQAKLLYEALKKKGEPSAVGVFSRL